MEAAMDDAMDTDVAVAESAGGAAGPLVVAPLRVPAPDADSGKFSWTVTGWSQVREKKLLSDVFTIAGKKWKLLLFPTGNTDHNQYVSLYLDSSSEPAEAVSLYDHTTFSLVLHGHDGKPDVRKESSHNFSVDKPDWGFNQFLLLSELRDVERKLIHDDAVTFSVELRVVRETNWNTYDSKTATGFVGLKNQGATCYMNSLLQTLFHIPFFRKAVYHMPTTEADRPETSIPLALQALFYKMQFGEHAASTKDLTKSFGWDTAESFQQHDVQELNRVLCDKLDEKMKGTSVEGTMAALFEGHTETFLECTDVPYASTKRESFMDLQLDVKGCRDVAASFAKYIEEERLDGDNKYHAEGHGLQNARKGIRFLHFPPVLQLQLKRFEYDFTRDMMGKIHDRYEFPTELDLNRFLHVPPPGAPGEAPPAPAPDARYVLHSVLVHSGGANGGHYYAFVRPCGGAAGGDWFRFDDERVTREEAVKAVDDNFGEGGSGGGDDDGRDGKQGGGYPPLWKAARLSSAYMLVYVRACDLDKMVFPVAESDILAHVRERLAAETAEKARKDKEKREAHLYTVVKVARDADIAARVCARDGDAAFDLVEHDKVTHIRVEKSAPFSTFKALAAEELGVPVEAQRWWLWSKRQNATFRPSRAITAAEESTAVSAIRETPAPAAQLPLLHSYTAKRDTAASNELLLLLEAPWSPAGASASNAPLSPPPPLSKSDILLFFKLYDPVRETVSYIGRAFVSGGTKVGDLQPVVLPLLAAHGVAPTLPTAELLYFEEIKFEPVMVELLDKKSTLKTSQMEHGDIIVVQRALSAAEADVARFPVAPEFMTFVRNRLVVTFRELDAAKSAGGGGWALPPLCGSGGECGAPPPLTLELARTSSYDDVTSALAGKLGLSDSLLLRLTGHNTYLGAPKPNAYRYRERATLLELLSHYAGATADTLYYEILDLPLPQLEALKTLRVDWYDDKVELVRTFTLRLPKGARVRDALRALREQLTTAGLLPAVTAAAAADAEAPQLRLLEVFQSKIYKVCTDDECVDTINDSYWRMRAEAVPADQAEACIAPGERLLNCVHVCRESSYGSTPSAIATAPVGASTVSAFGDPFLLKVREDETLRSVKARVAAKLGIAVDAALAGVDANGNGPAAAAAHGEAPAAAAPAPPGSAADFAGWKWGVVTLSRSEHFGSDDDMVGARFRRASRDAPHALCGALETFLGMEHAERRPKRTHASSYTRFDKSVKIYG